MCEKNNSVVLLTTWAVGHVELLIGKTNTTPRKGFRLAPINKVATSILPSTFINMLLTLRVPSNAKVLCISQL